MNANAANFDPGGDGNWQPNHYNENISGSYVDVDAYGQYTMEGNIDMNVPSMAMYPQSTAMNPDNMVHMNMNNQYDTSGNLYYDTMIHEPQSVQLPYSTNNLPSSTHPPVVQAYYEEYRFFSPLQNASISKINLDSNHDELIYVSSHANNSMNSSSSHRSNMPNKSNRTSYLAAHFIRDGGLYSTVCAHPDPNTLIPTPPKFLNSSLGRAANTSGTPSGNNPSFTPNSTMVSKFHDPQQYIPPGHFGIGSLFHFPTFSLSSVDGADATKESIIGSISPYGIRLHSQGGLLLAEFPFVSASSSTNPNLLRHNKYNQPINKSFVPWSSCCGCLHSTPNYISSHVSATGTIYSQQMSNSSTMAQNNRMSIYTYDLHHGTCTSIHNVESGVIDIKATSWNQTLVTGCEDGFIRFFDTRILGKQQQIHPNIYSNGVGSRRGGGLTTVAQVSGQDGGVAQIALSPNGHTFCSTGYQYHSNPSLSRHAPTLYSSNEVLEFDTRYLGRGGIPHSFSNDAMGGVPGQISDPRFVKFMPDLPKTLMVASGQMNGIIKIVNLDEYSSNNDDGVFIDAALENGEKIMDLEIAKNGDLWVGTNFCGVIKMKRNSEFWGDSVLHSKNISLSSGAPNAGYSGNDHKLHVRSEPMNSPTGTNKIVSIEIPPFVPPPPQAMIDPLSIQIDNEESHSSFNPFQKYTLLTNPQLTSINDDFDPIVNRTMIAAPRRTLSKTLESHLTEKDVQDFVASVSSTSLGIKLTEVTSYSDNSTKNGKKNPNKLLYSRMNASKCYDLYADPRKKTPDSELNRESSFGGAKGNSMNSRSTFASSPTRSAGGVENNSMKQIPTSYRRMIRPPATPQFNYMQFNSTKIWPGWDDYGGNMPNAYAAPIIVILYFTPEIRNILWKRQFDQELWEKHEYGCLSVELGFLFHQMYQRSIHALTHPHEAQVSAFNPSSFLSTLSLLPEASALALLDGAGSSASDEYLPRRLEAFWRFLVHHLDRETSSSNQNENENKLMDNIYGMDFVNVNEFVNGSSPPTIMNTRSLTVELSYDTFLSKMTSNPTGNKTFSTQNPPSFGKILLHSLCKETRLRAWSKDTKKFATVVQRKILKSLPKVMAITCAGKKGENKDSVKLWKSCGKGWLPERIQVEIKDHHRGNNIIVREFVNDEWQVNEGGEDLSDEQSKPQNLGEPANDGLVMVRTYELVAIVSFVHSNSSSHERNVESTSSSGDDGNHVVHIRIPRQYKKKILSQQTEKVKVSRRLAENLETCFTEIRNLSYECPDYTLPPLTQASQVPSSQLQDRALISEKMIEDQEQSDEWILVNGFVVTKTSMDAACDFTLDFREPCLVLYRDIDDMKDWASNITKENVEEAIVGDCQKMSIPVSVMDTPSLTSSPQPQRSIQNLPGKGDIVAIDAEFVLVQHEESIINEYGSKVTTKEGRHALARVSVIDCNSGDVIIDDYVLSQEPVVDYLTRFSGIHPSDLDPANSPHHLVTMRTAYLKLRLLLDRGCIFLGHGLDLDFRMLNIFVPPSQIIDTVTIFRQSRSRMISLRFLANYLLGYDMQQDTHDSIEDAKAAHELYLKAIELKKAGKFGSILSEIYEFGKQNDWKLGRNSTPKR